MEYFLGIGESKSTSNITNTVNQKIINEVDLKTIKESVNKNIMNTITENSSSCSAAISQDQEQVNVIGGIKGGNVNIAEISQSQRAKLSLSCVDVSKIENNLANDVANAFSTQLESKFDTDAMAKLDANAKTQASTGAFALGSSSSDSNVSNTYNLNVSNKISKTMKDMISNEIQRNFNTKTLKARLANMQQKQKQTNLITQLDGANLDIGKIGQDQDADLVMKAVSEDSTITNTIDKVMSQLNSISTEGVTTKASGDASAKTDTSAQAKGVDSLLDSFFSGLSSLKYVFIMLIIGAVVAIGIFFFTGGQETLQKGIDKAAGGRISNFECNELINVFKKF